MVFIVFSLLLVGVFATAADNSVSDDIQQKVQQISQDNNLVDDVSSYVENFAQRRGINSEDINNISKVEFNDLPKEVNIEDVNDANLVIYGVNYNDSKESSPEKKNKQLFVITYSVDKLRSQGDIIIAHDKRMFLNFGSSGEMSSEGFLDTATGVEGSLDAGYVMMRSGSITGISTNLQILNFSSGSIKIVIYKNGEPVNFGNLINSDSSGVEKDYDLQSNNVVKFNSGDVISVYAESDNSEVSWKNVISIVEITTN